MQDITTGPSSCSLELIKTWNNGHNDSFNAFFDAFLSDKKWHPSCADDIKNTLKPLDSSTFLMSMADAACQTTRVAPNGDTQHATMFAIPFMTTKQCLPQIFPFSRSLTKAAQEWTNRGLLRHTAKLHLVKGFFDPYSLLRMTPQDMRDALDEIVSATDAPTQTGIPTPRSLAPFTELPPISNIHQNIILCMFAVVIDTQTTEERQDPLRWILEGKQIPIESTHETVELDGVWEEGWRAYDANGAASFFPPILFSDAIPACWELMAIAQAYSNKTGPFTMDSYVILDQENNAKINFTINNEPLTTFLIDSDIFAHVGSSMLMRFAEIRESAPKMSAEHRKFLTILAAPRPNAIN